MKPFHECGPVTRAITAAVVGGTVMYAMEVMSRTLPEKVTDVAYIGAAAVGAAFGLVNGPEKQDS